MQAPVQETPRSPVRWPPQVKYIVGNEAAERFSFYGMKSILALYISMGLMQSKDRATTIIHLFVCAAYFTPLLGAWVADRLWGRYSTILWISLFYCVGHGVLATSDLFGSVDAKLTCLYVGLGLIAFGAGGIKPCVSAFMGDQFSAEQSHLMRKAYGVFYFSINFGSCFSFLIIPWIAAKPVPLAADAGWFDRLLWQLKDAGFSGYGWAFGVPGILMAVATLIFWLGTKHYVCKPPTRQTRSAGYFKVFVEALKSMAPGRLRIWGWISLVNSVVLPVITMIGMLYVGFAHEMTHAVKTVGWIALGCLIIWYLLLLVTGFVGRTELPDGFWAGVRNRFGDGEVSAARSVAPIVSIFAFVVPFWALFDQSNSTWVMQGTMMQPIRLLGLNVGAEQMQSLNPLLVMILVPLMTWGIYPCLERLGLKVTPLRRISAGLLLAGTSFIMVAWIQQRIESGAVLSLAWQAVPYIILTAAEVLVSTTGLEFAYTQAGGTMKSAVMSFWFVSVALGNLLVATITRLGGGHGDESVTSGRFLSYAGLMAVAGVLFIVVAVRYRYREAATKIE